MHFSSIAALVDAHLQTTLAGRTLTASLFLFVAAKDPLVLEDALKARAVTPLDDLEAYLQSYDKIQQGSTILLENVSLNLQFGRGHSLTRVEISSKRVVGCVGSGEEKELRNFELKVVLAEVEGELPLTLATHDYLRRMERQELVRKHYKPSKVNPTNFTKRSKQQPDSPLSSLDTESVSLLRGLLGFTDKEELFRVLLRKPLRDRSSKKAVRLSIVPTDVEEGEEGEIRKRGFNRQTVLQLLSEYEARDAQLQ